MDEFIYNEQGPYILELKRRATEAVLIEALSRHLKRKPEIQDFKKCVLGHCNNMGNEWTQFSYGDVLLGFITYQITGNSVKCELRPDNDKKRVEFSYEFQ